jgi:hypothetical protein
MKKFLVLYTAPISAREQIARATPEQAKAGMEAWMTWARKAGEAIIDLGAPLGNGRTVAQHSVKDAAGNISGYSLLQADSLEAVTKLLQEHPHSRMPDFAIQVLECLAMPGEMANRPPQAA